MIYGYARVSSAGQAIDGNSLESQEEALKAAGATKIFKEVYYELQDAEYLQCRSRAPFLNRIIPWNSQKSVADDVHLHSNIYQTL